MTATWLVIGGVLLCLPMAQRDELVASRSDLIGARLPFVENTGQDMTVLIVISSACQPCSQSSPFYTELSRIASHSHGRVQIVVASFEPAETTVALAIALEIKADRVITLQRTTIAFPVEPTVLLLDSSGLVTEGWSGFLAPGQESRAIGLLS